MVSESWEKFDSCVTERKTGFEVFDEIISRTSQKWPMFLNASTGMDKENVVLQLSISIITNEKHH